LRLKAEEPKLEGVSLSPKEARSHFGWLAMFAGMDFPASSLRTQQRVNWRPAGPGLIRDLEHHSLPKEGPLMRGDN
jgi:hypothetical protein